MTSSNKTYKKLLRAALFGSVLFPLWAMTGCDTQTATSIATSHVDRAETYLAQGQFRSALLEVKNAIENDPNNVDNIVTLAEIYIDIGASRQASDLLKPWLEENPEQVALPLARAYQAQGKHLSATETLLAYSPISATERLEQQALFATSKRLAGATTDAIFQYQAVLSENPNHKTAIIGYAEALLASNQTGATIEMLKHWTERNGEDAEILYLSGVAYHRQGNNEQATAILTDATSNVPGADIFLPIRRKILTLLSLSLTTQGRISDAQIYNTILAEYTDTDARDRAELAVEAINQGEFATARAALEELMQQTPEDGRVALILGTLKLQEGLHDEAELLLTPNVDPETTPTSYIRAATLAQIDTGKAAEALKTLSRAIEARSSDPELLAMHGLLGLSLAEHQEAGAASLDKALEIDPSRVRLRLALAKHYLILKQQDKALSQLRIAFTESPSDWVITQTYIDLLLTTERYEEAEEVKNSLLQELADETNAVALASITEQRLGKANQARARLEDQLEQTPDNVMVRVALAFVYEQQGEMTKAVATTLKAAQLQPDNINLLQSASRLYAAEHSLDELAQWLVLVGTDHPELTTHSSSLAALIRLQQGELEQSRELLSRTPPATQNEFARAVTGQLLVAETNRAVHLQEWEKARSTAAQALALQPDNLRLALLPVDLFRLEGKDREALIHLDELEMRQGPAAAIDLMRARLLTTTKSEQAAWIFLQQRWRETGHTELLPTLIELAKSEAPESLGTLVRVWAEAEPDNVAANLTQAEFAMLNGDEKEAIASYEELLTQQPDNLIALNNLAWMLRRSNPERALKLSSRAQVLDPNNPSILDTHGWVLHLAGRHQDAKQVIEKALTLAPDSQEIRQHLEAVNQSL